MSTLVIGSGITGMAAALLLARQGEETAILEAASVPAPLLRGFDRDGLHFDTGFHCGAGLRRGGLLRLWLHALGIMDFLDEASFFPIQEEFRFPPGDADAATAAITRFPAQFDELAAAVTEQFDAQASQNFLKLVRDMFAVLQHSPYTTPHRDIPLAFSWGQSPSLHDALAAARLPLQLSRMTQARCAFYGIEPHRASFHEFSFVGGLYFDSCHGISGGGKTLRQASLKALERAGVSVRCNALVTRITHTCNRVSGVELASGERIACTRCIFTGHPGQLRHLMDAGAMRPAFFRHIGEMRDSMQAFLLFGSTSKPFLRHKTLYIMPPISEETREKLAPLESRHPLIYLCCDETQQNGRFPVVAVSPTVHNFPEGDPQPRPDSYSLWKQEVSGRILEYIRARVPELDDLAPLDAATPLSLRHWIAGSSGSLYGLAHDTETLALFPSTRLEHFFLAGQHVLLPGILGGIISAALAVGFATSHDAVLQGFRQCANNE